MNELLLALMALVGTRLPITVNHSQLIVIREVRRLLKFRGHSGWDHEAQLRTWFDWSPDVAVQVDPVYGVTYRGTLHRRLRRFFKIRNVPIGNDDISAMLSSANRNWEFATECEFVAGPFEPIKDVDHFSDLWHNGMVQRLHQLGALSIRALNSDSCVGRAWVLPIANNRLLVFNGIGSQGWTRFTTEWFASLANEHVGVYTNEVRVNSRPPIFVMWDQGFVLSKNPDCESFVTIAG